MLDKKIYVCLICARICGSLARWSADCRDRLQCIVTRLKQIQTIMNAFIHVPYTKNPPSLFNFMEQKYIEIWNQRCSILNRLRATPKIIPTITWWLYRSCSQRKHEKRRSAPHTAQHPHLRQHTFYVTIAGICDFYATARCTPLCGRTTNRSVIFCCSLTGRTSKFL